MASGQKGVADLKWQETETGEEDTWYLINGGARRPPA